MNRIDCKYLAKRNRKAHRGNMMKAQIFLTISTVLFIIFIGVFSFLKGSYAQITQTNKAWRYIEYDAATVEEAIAFRDYARDQSETASVSVSAVSVMDPPDLEIDSTEQIQLSVDNSFLIVDGVETVGQLQADMTNNFIPIYLTSFLIDDFSSYQLIPDCEREEYQAKTGTNDLFLAGSEFQNRKQIILSETILNCFGYPSEQQSALIGKEISLGFYYENQQYLCIKGYTLQGILKKEYFNLSNKGIMTPQMWLSYDENETMLSYRYDIGGTVNPGYSVLAYLDDFGKLETMQERFAQAGFPTQFSTVQLIAVWLYDGMLLLNKIVLFVMLFFVCIMLISVCNSLYFYYDVMQTNYHMLSVLGTDDASIKRICIYELSAIFVRAYGLSILISLAGLKLISYISSQFLQIQIDLVFHDYLTAVLISGLLLLLLFALFYFIFPNRVLRKQKL